MVEKGSFERGEYFCVEVSMYERDSEDIYPCEEVHPRLKVF